MPNSLKNKFSSLRYKGLITDEEYKELVKKLNGHDREIRNKAIDDFAKRLKSDEFQKYNLDFVFETSRDLSYSQCINAFEEYIDEIAEQIKEEVRENGDNRKLLHETGDGQ